jgi:hypothetical protein
MLKSFSELSDEEYKAVKRELADRWRDAFFMNAFEKVSDQFDRHLKYFDYKENDLLTISYQFQIIWNDVIQIVGRIRRKNARKKP